MEGVLGCGGGAEDGRAGDERSELPSADIAQAITNTCQIQTSQSAGRGASGLTLRQLLVASWTGCMIPASELPSPLR